MTALLVAIGAGSFFWPSSDEAVQITFIGPSTNHPSALSFAVTNTKTNRLLSSIGFRIVTNGVRSYEYGMSDGLPEGLGPTNRIFFDTGIISTNRWSVVVIYTDPAKFTAFDRMRSNVRAYFLKHGWRRISRWLFPAHHVKRAFGPEMLGNKPAPPTRP